MKWVYLLLTVTAQIHEQKNKEVNRDELVSFVFFFSSFVQFSIQVDLWHDMRLTLSETF